MDLTRDLTRQRDDKSRKISSVCEPGHRLERKEDSEVETLSRKLVYFLVEYGFRNELLERVGIKFDQKYLLFKSLVIDDIDKFGSDERCIILSRYQDFVNNPELEGAIRRILSNAYQKYLGELSFSINTELPKLSRKIADAYFKKMFRGGQIQQRIQKILEVRFNEQDPVLSSLWEHYKLSQYLKDHDYKELGQGIKQILYEIVKRYVDENLDFKDSFLLDNINNPQKIKEICKQKIEEILEHVKNEVLNLLNEDGLSVVKNTFGRYLRLV